MDSNPFDELELDPRLGPDELTEALKRRAERLEGAQKQRLQDLWRVLTINERDRLRWAFFAHPRPPHADPRSIDALRERVPPVISRLEPPPLEPTVEDALLFKAIGADERSPGLRPPSLFDG